MNFQLAPYMAWAKARPAARFDLAVSNVLACGIEDLPGAAGALALGGRNDNGYEPLLDAIAHRYGVTRDQVTTAQGASGANFLVFAALLAPGDDVLVERPGYDPLLGAPRLLGANIVRFDRAFEDGYVLHPGRLEAAMTPRTKLVIITSPHNPTGAVATADALRAIGRIAAARGAHVVVDEVYLDTIDPRPVTAVSYGDRFIVTSSLTKSYGLAGLRCGWILSPPDIAVRMRRARDVVDGTGSIVAERLSVVAFEHLDRLHARACALLDTNRSHVSAFLAGRPDLEYVAPQGGTVVFPRIRGCTDTTRFVERLLVERETAVVPGHFFESPQHFRLGFSGATESLQGGLERLGAALDAREW
ncbi:MAG TPA: pyridoxal phosphate-dependent aminotransferase [Vicinamibacterales bacterium]|nr:pyridoxal phosphate-dependent aminotransferase [Vicinamibacterales bacterium]